MSDKHGSAPDSSDPQGADARSPAPEFSRPIDLARIGTAETVHEISATAEEHAALARRFGLLALERLDARVSLRRAEGGTLLHLAGHLVADVTQACVVTLDPVSSHLEQDFTVIYGRMPDEADVSIEVDDDSAREPWPEGPLDIGEAVAQELALALDPYPHAAGAVLEPERAESDAPERVNPFSALAKLRNGKG